jgi:hypothetical protein
MTSFNQDVNIRLKIKETRDLSSVIWGTSAKPFPECRFTLV